MARLEILEFPDPRLRKKAAPVTVFDAELNTLIENMFETMYEAQGIGLAATQVNEHKIHEQLAVEVVNFVLETGGQNAVGFQLKLLAFAVQGSHPDAAGARDGLVKAWY